MYFIGGTGNIVGPPVAGFVIDHGGTYENSFVLCGVLFLLASVFTLISSNWRGPTKDIVREEVSCNNHEDQSHNMCNAKKFNISLEEIQTNVCPQKDQIDENDHLITEV
ncbi:Hypothetical predicted protein [Mytilus galloprovincialis]|uniref:Major facilitator superfamily (MFS) profile domain-containing protein n=1 Tax=Mytilus galloprovincialis TaxID=29158 RepID=A0A8B6FKT8_MYTGA|nr:Hypothetical predicted protein [Mytilus galloprovincialis]